MVKVFISNSNNGGLCVCAGTLVEEICGFSLMTFSLSFQRMICRKHLVNPRRLRFILC